MPYLLALGAAFFAACGAALQHREVAEVTESESGGLKLLWASFKRPGWWLGMAVLIIAPAFQFFALKVGNLSQVQPILTTELLFLLGIIIVTHHERPGRREWLASAGIVIGLVTFLVAAHPHGGVKTASSAWALGLSLATALVVGAFWLAASFTTGWAKAALLGSAAASCFAYQAAMTSIVAGVAAGSILTSPALIGLAVAGSLGFVLFQHALRAGHVAASRAAMVIVDPLLSVLIGVVVFSEVLAHGAGRVVFEIVGIVILVIAARSLALSPMISEDDPRVEEDAQAITP